MTTTAAAASLIEGNSALGRQFFQEQDRLRGGPAPELCAAGYRATLGSTPEMTREGHEGFAKAFYAAIPDLHHEIVETFATQDRVFVRFVLHGTNSGSFFGIPPTGKTITVPAHVYMEMSGGVVMRLFGVFDEAGLLRQLGILPSQ